MKRRVWQRNTSSNEWKWTFWCNQGFQMSANKTDVSWIGSVCNDVAGCECITHSTWHSKFTPKTVITTSNSPGGVGEQNPTIHNNWEKITWTSKFFRHDICRLGRFQSKSWKPWSENALWDSSTLCLWTNPQTLSQILWVLLEQFFNLTTLFSNLLKFIFPKQIFKGLWRSFWPYKCCWSALSGICRFEKTTRSVGEAQARFCFCLFARGFQETVWNDRSSIVCSLFLFTQLRTKTIFQSKDLGINWRVSQVCSSHSEKKHSFDILHSFSIKTQSRFTKLNKYCTKEAQSWKQWLRSSLFSPTECYLEQFWLGFGMIMFWIGRVFNDPCVEISLLLLLPLIWRFSLLRKWCSFLFEIIVCCSQTKTSMRVWTPTLRDLNQTPQHIQKKKNKNKRKKAKTRRQNQQFNTFFREQVRVSDVIAVCRTWTSCKSPKEWYLNQFWMEGNWSCFHHQWNHKRITRQKGGHRYDNTTEGKRLAEPSVGLDSWEDFPHQTNGSTFGSYDLVSRSPNGTQTRPHWTVEDPPMLELSPMSTRRANSTATWHQQQPEESWNPDMEERQPEKPDQTEKKHKNKNLSQLTVTQRLDKHWCKSQWPFLKQDGCWDI